MLCELAPAWRASSASSERCFDTQHESKKVDHQRGVALYNPVRLALPCSNRHLLQYTLPLILTWLGSSLELGSLESRIKPLASAHLPCEMKQVKFVWAFSSRDAVHSNSCCRVSGSILAQTRWLQHLLSRFSVQRHHNVRPKVPTATKALLACAGLKTPRCGGISGRLPCLAASLRTCRRGRLDERMRTARAALLAGNWFEDDVVCGCKASSALQFGETCFSELRQLFHPNFIPFRKAETMFQAFKRMGYWL